MPTPNSTMPEPVEPEERAIEHEPTTILIVPATPATVAIPPRRIRDLWATELRAEAEAAGLIAPVAASTPDQPADAEAVDDEAGNERHPGLVYCCETLGWVTPAQAFDHRWDAYSGTDE